MHLAQDNDVVHTFTPDRSDQPFGKSILPRRGWCGRFVPNAHGAQWKAQDGYVKKVRHPWLGGPRRLTMYLATLDCAISKPSLSSSP